jgi:hypothetical protein
VEVETLEKLVKKFSESIEDTDTRRTIYETMLEVLLEVMSEEDLVDVLGTDPVFDEVLEENDIGDDPFVYEE